MLAVFTALRDDEKGTRTFEAWKANPLCLRDGVGAGEIVNLIHIEGAEFKEAVAASGHDAKWLDVCKAANLLLKEVPSVLLEVQDMAAPAEDDHVEVIKSVLELHVECCSVVFVDLLNNEAALIDVYN